MSRQALCNFGYLFKYVTCHGSTIIAMVEGHEKFDYVNYVNEMKQSVVKYMLHLRLQW